MKDNALKYCTTIAFSAAMIGFGLASISRTDSDKVSGFCLALTAALWLAVCFGGPIAAGCRWLMSAYLRKSDAMRAGDQGGKES